MKIEANVIIGDWDKCKGLASITLDGVFVVSGLKVVEGGKGLFVSMPSRKDSKGEYKDICFPVTKDFRDQIIKTVLDAYAEKSGNSVESKTESHDDDFPYPF